MISSLRGRVLHLDADSLVVDVGGVGFAVAVTPAVTREFHIGDEIVLHTNLIVREDALSLFGFQEREELTVFTQLLSVSGVGPKSALGVLSSLTVDQIADAVTAEDDAPFRRVSGIGPKTAKLIVVQLAGKLLPTGRTGGARGAVAPAVASQVISALVALGWSERVCIDTVTEVSAGATPAELGSVAALLKLSLAHLGPARTEQSGV
ncbi:Holliday junction branch migration protein RuvA [uncultured Microbacterium sp.]|uniref:Holliday junction branch migration complex subunit RuvA n=1 Tax=uncultured Microbacterium sp. TaxID=191216 RepID=A0A1Y5P8W6_9MICO|nr:Holliday junction branch migration protein RuvA [uncultured Microbacterium sp.]SBS75136.1 Holliday junction ATP-dependent DNA helicase RuvA [uncultured Microbacterium sp.]